MTCDKDCNRCKFYCKDLRIQYPNYKVTGTDVHTFCVCENNIDKMYAHVDPRRFISTPSIINRYKNCNWFVLRDKENTYTWSSKDKPKYNDHGAGTYNINPKDGLEGFYIGEKNLQEIIDENTSETQNKLDKLYNLPFKHIEKINEYLYSCSYDILHEKDALEYIKENYTDLISEVGLCSSIRQGNTYGRNYDWNYDESVTFVVQLDSTPDRYESISVCKSPKNLYKSFLLTDEHNIDLYKVIPYLALDGINENGVVCNVNVVSYDEEKSKNWIGTEICGITAVRYVLDKAKTAEEGANLIKDKVWIPNSEKLGGYSLHYMVADKDSTYIVEDGIIYKIYDSKCCMTNFRCAPIYNFLEEPYVSVNKVAEYDPYGSGLERYAKLYFNTDDLDIIDLMKSVKYTEAYTSADIPNNPTDFTGFFYVYGVPVKCNQVQEIIQCYQRNDIHNKWLNRERDGKFWQTVHTSIYNIDECSLKLFVQEDYDNSYSFILNSYVNNQLKNFVKSISINNKEKITVDVDGNINLTIQETPSDYDTVKQNALIGKEHSENTDNPHNITAEQIDTYTKEVIDDKIDSINQTISDYSTVKQNALIGKEHSENTDNPHNITAEQIDTYTKDVIDDKVTKIGAHYVTIDSEGNSFPTKQSLLTAEVVYYGGTQHTPDENDYALVNEDESHDNKTCRYAYVKNTWQYSYTINNMTFEESQLDAINSGATKQKIDKIDTLFTKLTLDNNGGIGVIKNNGNIINYDTLKELISNTNVILETTANHVSDTTSTNTKVIYRHSAIFTDQSNKEWIVFRPITTSENGIIGGFKGIGCSKNTDGSILVALYFIIESIDTLTTDNTLISKNYTILDSGDSKGNQITYKGKQYQYGQIMFRGDVIMLTDPNGVSTELIPFKYLIDKPDTEDVKQIINPIKSSVTIDCRPEWFKNISDYTYGVTCYAIRGKNSEIYPDTVTSISSVTTKTGRATSGRHIYAYLTGYLSDGTSVRIQKSKQLTLSTNGEIKFEFETPVDVDRTMYAQIGIEFVNDSDNNDTLFVAVSKEGTRPDYGYKNQYNWLGSFAPAISFECVVNTFNIDNIVVKEDISKDNPQFLNEIQSIVNEMFDNGETIAF